MSNPINWFQQAIEHHRAGRLVDATVCYRQVLKTQPQNHQCHYNLALAQESLALENDAIFSYRQAIVCNPNFSEAHNNLGNIFQNQGYWDDAREAYSRALSINPKLAQAQYNLGLIAKKQNNPSLAVLYFQKAIEIAPEYTEAFENLCALQKALGRTEEWLDTFKQHEKIQRKADWFFIAGLSTCRYLGDSIREDRYLQEFYGHHLGGGELPMLSGMLSIAQYYDIPQTQLLRLYHSYNQAVKSQHSAPFPLVSPYRPERARIRIGYVSADFRVHVMGMLMLEVLSRHDRSQFELHLYSLAHEQDSVTAQFRAISEKFVDLHSLPASQAARLIAEDDLDILIDLGNHTSYANPVIFAYKPARIQITHLGAHGALGLDAIDFKMTDQYADV
ncbi:MAG: tetratricopeptide repeat protein, partial [Pseudomonadota bacterium]